jgi:hypothetical protein
VSSFKLSYYTLLNLLKRPEGGLQDLELVIANSFSQFQRDRAAPKVGCGCLCGPGRARVAGGGANSDRGRPSVRWRPPPIARPSPPETPAPRCARS